MLLTADVTAVINPSSVSADDNEILIKEFNDGYRYYG